MIEYLKSKLTAAEKEADLCKTNYTNLLDEIENLKQIVEYLENERYLYVNDNTSRKIDTAKRKLKFNWQPENTHLGAIIDRYGCEITYNFRKYIIDVYWHEYVEWGVSVCISDSDNPTFRKRISIKRNNECYLSSFLPKAEEFVAFTLSKTDGVNDEWNGYEIINI